MGYPIRKEFECSQNPDSKQALAISEEIINSFLSGETDAVELLYTKFVSLIASAPSVRTLVPFSASEISQKGDEVFQLTSSGGDFGVERKELDVAEPQEFPNDMIFEQDPLQIVNSILPLYLNGQILRTLRRVWPPNWRPECRACRAHLTTPPNSPGTSTSSTTERVRRPSRPSSLRLLREPPHSKDKHNANHERNLKLWTRKFTLVLIVGQRDGVWNRDLR